MKLEISEPAQLEQIEQAIRTGQYPDSPNLVYRYLAFGECSNPDVWKQTSRLEVCERLFNTLINAIGDPLVPLHWRRLCLDNIYRPLFTLEKLATTELIQNRLHHRYAEVALLANYNLVEETPI